MCHDGEDRGCLQEGEFSKREEISKKSFCWQHVFWKICCFGLSLWVPLVLIQDKSNDNTNTPKCFGLFKQCSELSYHQSRQHIKKQKHYFANKGPSSQIHGFSSSHEWMWELDYKESWALKKLCFWIVVLEKTLQSPLDSKETKPVNPKGNQSWIFKGRTDAEAETLILWPPDVKNWLFGKDPDARKDWKQEEKGTTEDEMVRWHHRLAGHEFEQAPRVGDGQGSLACCSPWGHKELGHN